MSTITVDTPVLLILVGQIKLANRYTKYISQMKVEPLRFLRLSPIGQPGIWLAMLIIANPTFVPRYLAILVIDIVYPGLVGTLVIFMTLGPTLLDLQ
jgi:hypothetical protein